MIGIDLTSLQGPHRKRGIGYTLINFVNNLPEEAKNYSFVFYVYEPSEEKFDPLSLLEVSDLNYEVRYISKRRKISRRLPGRLGLLTSVLNNLIEMKDLYRGDSRIHDLSGVKVFLQTDPNHSLPRKHGVKNMVVIYDLIPYVLEWDYLWSYAYARIRGYSRKAALRVVVRRKLFRDKFHINTKRAHKLLAISNQTASDFEKELGVDSNKIVVTPLGVNVPDLADKQPRLSKFVETPWGYIQRKTTVNEFDRYLLFVGGADRRRKLEDLVAAFNHLRARGENIKLVLAGDSMQGPANIATEEIQYALKTSSYIDDIIFMGFIDDVSRDWLYRHALAFVFPSRYEGFGLPILEAMSYGCPVITYDNTAIREVAGDVPLFVDGADEILDAVQKLSNNSKLRQDLAKKGVAHAKKYGWQRASEKIFQSLI